MIPIFITIASFLTMEIVAWFTHKYIMHGFLWKWHEDHHQPHEGLFEKNDRFFLIFAIPSASLFALGFSNPSYYLAVFIGLGILLYGIAYFLVHDVFIHRRFNWFKRTNNRYLKAIRKAHKLHHKNQGKTEGSFFGMLYISLSFYRSIR